MNQEEYPVDEETIHILLEATNDTENQATTPHTSPPVNQDISTPRPIRISATAIRNHHQDEELQTDRPIDNQTRHAYRRTLQLYEAQLRIHQSQAEHIEYLQRKIGFLEDANYQITQQHSQQTQAITALQHQNACLQAQAAAIPTFPQAHHPSATSSTMPGLSSFMANTPQQNKTLRRQRNRQRRKEAVRQMEALMDEREPSPSSPLIVMTTPSPTLHNSPSGEQTTHMHHRNSSPQFSNQSEIDTQIIRQSSCLKGELMSQIVISTYQTLVFSLVLILLAYIYAMLR